MKINEGMYVRTKKYGVAKIVGGTFGNKFNIDKFKNDGSTLRCIKLKDILKASYKIIDLIEAGDYINGKLVYYDEELECLGQNFVDADSNYYFESITKGGDYKIKTILTKEQYENNCYKVDDK